MQEEFSCQVMQGIGQNWVYRVYAVRYGENVTMSESVEVNLTGKLGFISRNGIMSEPCPRYDTCSSMKHILCSFIMSTCGWTHHKELCL